MNRLIKRTIQAWISWRSKKKLDKAYSWQRDIDLAIVRAKQSHGRKGKVRELERLRKDKMTQALAGRG